MMIVGSLSPESQKFISYLSNGMRPRSVLANVAIAKALADTCQIPSAPVEDVDNFYNVNLKIGVATNLNALNELVVVNAETILDDVLKFYKVRYYTTFPKKTQLCVNPDTVVADFFGISRSISPAYLEAIKQNPVELCVIYNGTRSFLDESSSK